MKRYEFLFKCIFIIIVCSFCFLCCKKTKKVCEPGNTRTGYCNDGTEAEQVCKADGSGWEAPDCVNTYSVWCDDTSGLCWQDPQKDAYNEGDTGLVYEDAVRYCEELNIAGYDDWRLPNIDELRTLIRGNPPTQSGGDCPLTEGSPMDAMQDEACSPVDEFGGPGPGGCYWPPDLSGTCDKPDPAAEGHPLEYMSSTVSSDNEHWVGCVLFDNGAVAFNHIHTYADVRCVRDAPTPEVVCEEDGGQQKCEPGATRQCTCENEKTGAQVCADDGDCWGPCECSGFEPSPPITDVCDQCDQIHLTIKVPEKIQNPPKMLMAFLYSAEGWVFPPNRPPDGGTDYDQVIDPEIDIDKPLELVVPGCTYYRESCLNGDYYLFVETLQTDQMPPVLQEGDYWWGMDQEPITLGTPPVEIIDMEITLVPWEEQGE